MVEGKIVYTVVHGEGYSAEEAFYLYMETRRRAIIMELRDVEKIMMRGGRLEQSALRPVRHDR